MRLLFTRNKSTLVNSILTYIICWFTWSRYSHVELLFSDDTCISSIGTKGVLMRSKGQILARNVEYLIKEIPTTAIQEAIIREFAMSQLGKPYDWGAVLGLPFRGRWDSDNRWFCPELCAVAFKQAGITLVDEHSSRITQRDLLVIPTKI